VFALPWLARAIFSTCRDTGNCQASSDCDHPGPRRPIQMSLNNDDTRQVWTRKEISEYLRLTERTVDNVRKRGQLPSFRIANNSVRFDREDVMALITRR
jgi:excisionase family DNA binding protein